MSLGWNMAAGMAFFSLTGYFIDQKTGSEDFWTLTGIFLGLLYCGYEVWRVIRTAEDKSNKKDV